VDTPLAVVVGETVPHGAAEHETLHATPLAPESRVTVAVNGAVVPAGTIAVGGTTDTVTGGIVSEPLPPPPQPSMAIVKPRVDRTRAENVKRHTTPPVRQPQSRLFRVCPG